MVVTSRHLFLAAVLLAHMLAGWGLWHSLGMRSAPNKPLPIVLSLIAASPPAPTPKTSPPALPHHAINSQLSAPPVPLAPPMASNLLVQTQNAAPTLVELAPQASTAAVNAQVEVPPRSAAPSTQAPTGPRQVASSALRYVVEPQMTVPLLSRRLGESGVVHLRIVVDANGRLKEASLKKSAGYARLDQQALLDIRSARFAPYLENGQPVEWETVALLSYEIDR
nr:energy transducer TonB [Roseateles albus]